MSKIIETTSFIQHRFKIIGGILVIAALISFIFNNNNTSSSTIKENQQLGKVYLYLNQGQTDSAITFLENFLSRTHTKVPEAKARLLLGKQYYNTEKYEEAIALFEKVQLKGNKYILLTSAAQQGISASYMQQKKYKEAAINLQLFIKTYGKQTHEDNDKSQYVLDAFVKLLFCLQQLDQKLEAEKLVTTLEKLYPKSEELAQAQRIIASW